jgi:hypothetical protein
LVPAVAAADDGVADATAREIAVCDELGWITTPPDGVAATGSGFAGSGFGGSGGGAGGGSTDTEIDGCDSSLSAGRRTAASIARRSCSVR